MKKLWFDEKYAYLEHEDGTIGRLVIARSPRLARATKEELENYRFMVDGIHWPAVDEDIPFDAFDNEETEAVVDLGAIPEYVSMSYLAQRFFGRSRSWLHNKLKGNFANGKPIAFTPQEMADLKKALEILSSEIKDVATQLPC